MAVYACDVSIRDGSVHCDMSVLEITIQARQCTPEMSVLEKSGAGGLQVEGQPGLHNQNLPRI